MCICIVNVGCLIKRPEASFVRLVEESKDCVSVFSRKRTKFFTTSQKIVRTFDVYDYCLVPCVNYYWKTGDFVLVRAAWE